MAAPLYLTKGELRSKLLTRLGYGGIGAGAGMFVPMADDLLEEAQEQLFQIFTDEKGVREWEFSTGVNQRWYDIPDTCDIDRILGMYAQQNGDEWRPLTRGIDHTHDSEYEDREDYPSRYDIRVRNPIHELQPNGDMSTPISGAYGDASKGWTWGLNDAHVSGGVLTFDNLDSVYSSFAVTAGKVYDITYTVGVFPLLFVNIGGATQDVNGVALPKTIGVHSVRVQPTSSNTPSFFGQATGTLDDVSIKLNNPDAGGPQIEIWPKADAIYQMKIEGPMEVGAFVADGDRASFDSRLILLYAVAYGKAHLNRQDAKSAMDAWTLRLKQIRANQHGTRRYVRRNPSRPEREVLARPKVV